MSSPDFVRLLVELALLLATAMLLSGATAGCFDYLSNSEDFRQGEGGSPGTGGTGGTGGTSTTSVPAACIPNGTSKIGRAHV